LGEFREIQAKYRLHTTKIACPFTYAVKCATTANKLDIAHGSVMYRCICARNLGKWETRQSF